MFVMDYTEGQGWHDARIVPYAPISLLLAAMVSTTRRKFLRVLKLTREATALFVFFRPYKNFERMNLSADRLAIPKVDVDFCVEALKQLVELDRDWIPEQEGASLYIRPFIIATDEFLGVSPSKTYKFFIICSRADCIIPRVLTR